MFDSIHTAVIHQAHRPPGFTRAVILLPWWAGELAVDLPSAAGIGMERAISLLGLFAMVGVAWLMSSHKSRVSPRVVMGGILLQLGLAWLVLETETGQDIFKGIAEFFKELQKYVDEGSLFVFGVNAKPEDPPAPHMPPNFVLLRSIAFGVLPTIVFFSSLMSILYYLGVMQRVVGSFAWVMRRTLGTSGSESLSAAANVFVGQTEAPLLVRPYVSSMTQSELMAVMVGGFATIAGGVLFAYISMGIDATHLLTASVISAPAALVIAKVMVPETEQSHTLGHVDLKVARSGVNIIEAAASGATDGLKLAFNVAAMLIAFLALIAMLDAGIGLLGQGSQAAIGWLGERLGTGWEVEFHWSLSRLLGYLFWPFAWLMGIESRDCLHAGELLGLKMAANEFVAYLTLQSWMQPESGVQLSDRSVRILTYALCGFANFGSIGIQIGGIGGIAPERRGDLAKIGFKAMLGGTLAAFMTACVAGIFE